MAAPQVMIREQDLSTRVPEFPGVYCGIVIPGAKKGLVGVPVLATSESDFLRKFTPEGVIKVGYDLAYYSALTALQKTNKLWVVRPQATGMSIGGCSIEPVTSDKVSLPFISGEADPTAHVFDTESFTIVGVDPGAYNDDLRIRIYNYKTDEIVSINATTNVLTVTQSWGSGYPVKISSTGTIPGGLSSTSTYFVVNVSATTIKLATSYNNAVAGTPVTIDITNTGTGVVSIRPAINYTREADTFAIAVYHKSNLNDPIEDIYVCSKVKGTKDGYGRNIYLEDTLQQSNYIRAVDNLLVSDLFVKDQIIPLALSGGSDGSAVTDGQCILALQTLANPDDTRLTVIMDGGRATPNYHLAMIDLCSNRKDCVYILSVPYECEVSSDYMNKIIEYRKYTLNVNNSYGSLYSSHVLIYDKFNDRDIWISSDGFAAAMISETAANYELWYPTGGFKRGMINVKDVRRRFSKGEMDLLYDNGINPIRYAPGRGILFWGQKTLSSRPSSLDRLNVRLLLIVVEPAVAFALEDFIMEQNTPSTRAVATAMVTSYMENIQARKGVSDFYVVCNDSNNTAQDIDNHRMPLFLFVKPVQSIEYIPFTTIITPTGMSFQLAQQAI